MSCLVLQSASFPHLLHTSESADVHPYRSYDYYALLGIVFQSASLIVLEQLERQTGEQYLTKHSQYVMMYRFNFLGQKGRNAKLNTWMVYVCMLRGMEAKMCSCVEAKVCSCVEAKVVVSHWFEVFSLPFLPFWRFGQKGRNGKLNTSMVCLSMTMRLVLRKIIRARVGLVLFSSDLSKYCHREPVYIHIYLRYCF